MTIKQITRKDFIHIMENYANILIAAPYIQKPEEYRKQLKNAISQYNCISEHWEKRTVEHATQNRLVFSDDSIFSFDSGKYNLYDITNDEGIRFVVVENLHKDLWTNSETAKYIIYIICAAENSNAKREYRGITTQPEKAEKLRKFLKCNAYKYELSDAGINKHFEILASDKELDAILENIA